MLNHTRTKIKILIKMPLLIFNLLLIYFILNWGSLAFASTIPNAQEGSPVIITFGAEEQTLTLTPEFSPTTFDYTLPIVTNNVTSLDITAIGEDTSKVLINDKTPTDGTANIPLVVGPNTITIKVTPNTDTTIINTYTLTVHRAADVALSSLETNIGTLSPAFNAETKAYTVTLDTLANAIDVTATPNDPDTTIKIKEKGDGTGTQTQTIAITAGTNTIPINITGSDGVTTGEYTLTVIRPAALASLTIDNGTLTPAFDANTQTYTATVSDRITAIDVTATVEAGALYINGTLQTSGIAKAVNLNVGTNEITIKTEIAGTTRTYTLTITRTASNVSLSNLTTDIGTWDKDFTAGETSYTVTLSSVDPLANAINITATPVDAGATVKINGTGGVGNQTVLVPLNPGINTISVVVSGWDGETTGEYTLTVIRPAALTALTIDNGTLTPEFNSNTQIYTATVSDRITAIDVTATVEEGAELSINGDEHTSGTPKTVTLSVGSNTITIKPEIAGTTRTYTLNVTRTASNVSLSNLTTDIGTWDKGFASNTYEYTVTLDSLADEIEVTATPVDLGAIVTIDGEGTGDAGEQTVSVNIAAGTNSIPINITGSDGETTKTYTINVVRPGALTALTIDGISLDQDFDANNQTYTATVNDGVTAIDVTATVEEGAELSINGDEHTSGTPKEVTLSVGSNTITIEAKIAGTTRTYTLNVTRTASNVSLSNLTINSGTLSPAFTPETFAFQAIVDSTINKISVTATPTDSEATVSLNGVSGVSIQTAEIPLDYGVNLIEIIITGLDAVTSQTYTIEVTRPGGLAALTVDEAELFPAFDPEILNYTINVPNSTTELDITATLQSVETQQLLINNVPQTSSTARKITLAIGPNPITIQVIMTGLTRTYTLTVNRAMSEVINTDLWQLTTDVGAFTPAFDPAMTSYTLNVDNTVDNLTINAIPFDVKATVLINGQGGDTGTQSINVPLEQGDNFIPISIRAADESTSNTYTIKVIRGFSSNAGLQALSVDTGILTPDFNKDTATYKVETEEEINQIAIRATTADSSATFTINKLAAQNAAPLTISLDHGGNLIPIVVTAPDQLTQKAYIISVNGKVSNANLSGLAVKTISTINPETSETIHLNLEATVTEYQISVDNTITSLELMASPADNKALILLNNNILPSGEDPSEENAHIDLTEGENTIELLVVAQDASTKTYQLKVFRGAPLTIDTATLPIGILDTPYTATLSAFGGYTPYTWSATGLPSGLSINSQTGEISGTPETEGFYDLTVTVTDAQENNLSRNFTLRLNLGCGNGGYLITPAEDPAYTIEHTIEGLPVLTIQQGFSGYRTFSVNIVPVKGHPGNEALVFAHLRNGKQIQGNSTTADYDHVSTAQAGFNVRPGDMIKIYLVDDLFSDTPVIL